MPESMLSIPSFILGMLCDSGFSKSKNLGTPVEIEYGSLSSDMTQDRGWVFSED